MGRPGWNSSLILAAALAVTPLLAKPQADFPLIRIPTLRDVETTKEGKSKPIVASRNGAKYIFKANQPFVFRGTLTTRHGNFEAELIANKIMKKLGMRVPNLFIVRIEGRRELHLRIRFAGDRFTKGAKVEPLRYVKVGTPMDDEAMRWIQLVDLLIANMDRHGDNVLMFPGPDGVLQPVPIDHNLAFLTKQVSEQRGWLVQTIPPKGAAAQDRRWREAQTSVGDTYVSKKWHSGADHWAHLLRKPGATENYLRQAAQLEALMTDEFIEELIGDLPDEIMAGLDVAERKQYLRDALRQRRSRLVSFFEEYMPQWQPRRPKLGGFFGGKKPAPPPRRRQKVGITGVSKTPDQGPGAGGPGPGTQGRPKNWLERLWGQ